MGRRKLLIGNWKLNHTKETAISYFDSLQEELGADLAIDLAIAPVAPMLDFVRGLVTHKNIYIAAQNVFYERSGAFTGEWSAEQLRDCGIAYCLVGHSERRKIFHESDMDVARKARACLDFDIIPVVCIGETEDERDRKMAKAVIEDQVTSCLKTLNADDELVFSYEPIWAIGTGRAARAQDAQAIHEVIRNRVAVLFGFKAAERTRVIYGGSVTGENIKEIVTMPDVDGALVGGASLQAKSFLTMVRALQEN